jgi:hypothetical protein
MPTTATVSIARLPRGIGSIDRVIERLCIRVERSLSKIAHFWGHKLPIGNLYKLAATGASIMSLSTEEIADLIEGLDVGIKARFAVLVPGERL